MKKSFVKELGLDFRVSFASDKLFYLALAGAPFTLLLLSWLLPAWGNNIRISLAWVPAFVLWQPLMEELLFRGVLQGQLRNNRWARNQIAGLSLANLTTTLFFMLAHLVHHTVLWAGAVIVPSLIFGYFRDRHGHIYSALILHAVYNACYLLLGACCSGTAIGW